MPAGQSAARKLCYGRAAREVDYHVGDWEVELGARPLDDPGLEPVRAIRWVRRDHDLVGSERAQLVLDRDQRALRTDLTGYLETRVARPVQALLEPLAGVHELGVDVRHRIVDAREQDRGNDPELGPRRPTQQRRAQLRARERLVRDDQCPRPASTHGVLAP